MSWYGNFCTICMYALRHGLALIHLIDIKVLFAESMRPCIHREKQWMNIERETDQQNEKEMQTKKCRKQRKKTFGNFIQFVVSTPSVFLSMCFTSLHTAFAAWRPKTKNYSSRYIRINLNLYVRCAAMQFAFKRNRSVVMRKRYVYISVCGLMWMSLQTAHSIRLVV